MTVAELIEELKTMPQDMKVVIEYWENYDPFFGEVDRVDVCTRKVTHGYEEKEENVVHIR